MDEPELVFGNEIKQLWGAALFNPKPEWLEAHGLTEPTRPRPWTREEVHDYLRLHKGVDSMKLVNRVDFDELLKVFAGEPPILLFRAAAFTRMEK